MSEIKMPELCEVKEKLTITLNLASRKYREDTRQRLLDAAKNGYSYCGVLNKVDDVSEVYPGLTQQDVDYVLLELKQKGYTLTPKNDFIEVSWK